MLSHLIDYTCWFNDYMPLFGRWRKPLVAQSSPTITLLPITSLDSSNSLMGPRHYECVPARLTSPRSANGG